MRNQIKQSDISFDNGSKVITVSNHTFTKSDVVTVYNRTKDEVIASLDAEDRTFSVANSTIDFSANAGVSALTTNDELVIVIEEETDIPRYILSVTLTGNSAAVNINQEGIVVDIGLASSVMLNGVIKEVPFSVSYNDILTINGSNGQTCDITINYIDNKTILLAPAYGGKIIDNGINGAYYSPYFSKIIVLSSFIFDEDLQIISYDPVFYTVNLRGGIFKPFLEVDGILYFQYMFGGSVSSLNLSTKQITNYAYGSYVDQLVKIGNYLYSLNYTSLSVSLAIHLPTGITNNISLNNVSNLPSTPDVVGGSALFTLRSNSLHRIIELSVSYITVGASSNYAIAYFGGYIYCCFSISVQKIDVGSSPMTIVSTITSNYNGTVARSIVVGTYLFTLYGNGTITKLNLSTFISPEASISTGYSIGTTPDYLYYNGYLYIIPRGNSVYLRVRISDLSYTTFNLQFTHNSINVDSINNRLIFFTSSLGIKLFSKVEIIQL